MLSVADELECEQLISIRLQCLEMVSRRANELAQRGVDVSPEALERWTKRMETFVLYGNFGLPITESAQPTEANVFVASMMEPVGA